jgi:hypothetical protein
MMSRNFRFKSRFVGCIAVLALALALSPAPALQVMAQDRSDSDSSAGAVVDMTADGGEVMVAGASVTVQGNAASVRAAGADVSIRGNVERDLRAAGARVEINATVGGNLKAAGASVEMRGRVAEDAYVAGAVVDLNLVSGGDLNVGGADVNLGPGTDVGGDLKGGGANFSVAGHIAGDVQIGGGLVTFNGRADGPVEITGNDVVVGDQATIGGDLTITSRNDPVVSETAVIAGQIVRKDLPQWWSQSPWVWAASIAIGIAIATFVAGVVLMLFGGRIFVGAVDLVRHRPVSSVLVGLAVVVVMLIVAGILMSLVIGFSAGIAILLLLPPLVIFGHAVAAAGIAAGIFIRSRGLLGIGQALLMLLVGAVIVVLIGAIPWVGLFLALVVLLLGVGALARVVGARLRGAASNFLVGANCQSSGPRCGPSSVTPLSRKRLIESPASRRTRRLVANRGPFSENTNPVGTSDAHLRKVAGVCVR